MVTDKTLTEQNKPQASVDATPKVAEVSSASNEPAPKDAPRTFTQTELDAILQTTKREAGRKWKGDLDKLAQERDTLASQVEELKEIETRLKELEEKNPEGFNWLQEKRKLGEERRKLLSDLKVKEDALEEREETAKPGLETLREIAIWDIASEFQDGDAVRLKTVCEITEEESGKKLTQDGIRRLAETLWQEKAEEGEKAKAPKPYSGKSDGGTPYFTRAQIADRAFWTAHKDEIEKAAKEGRIRD